MDVKVLVVSFKKNANGRELTGVKSVQVLFFLRRDASVSLISFTVRCGSPVFGTKEALDYCCLRHDGATSSNTLVAAVAFGSHSALKKTVGWLKNFS